ncbi:MAG: cytochrome c [Gammaproteobacteria bacterium]|jgi:cytochrome c556|nr:cytochrome c [Gammaproteobacteria bacterium]
MSRLTGKNWLGAAAVGAALLSLPALSHFDDKQMPQSYRQSYFALLAANFGPMVGTVKGEIPWDQARMDSWAHDLAALATLDIMRGFVDGSDKGTTRAKPEIWQDKADFGSKMDALRKELASLQKVTAGGDREAIAAQVGAAGKACKSCHDDYKAEDYLY